MADYDYDLFVIGAGSGGVRAARIAASLGAKVAIAEEHRVGGTCVIRGCVPKKLFVYAAHFKDDFEDAEGYGWSIGDTSFSWGKLIAAKDKEIDRLNGIYIRNLGNSGVEIIDGRAILADAHTVEVAGKTVTAETILVATGGWPFKPDIPGIEHSVSSNEMFHHDELPRRALVVGGGFIAVEFAGILNGLGVDVTLSYRGEQILRGFDQDMRDGLAGEMVKKGIDVKLGSVITGITKTASGLVVSQQDGGDIETDLVLYATGRVPNTGGLGLENAGVEMSVKGAVVVDDYSRSSVSNIYAVGDVTDRVALTPVAIREGQAFAETLYGGKPTTTNYENIPSAVFSQPPIGTVGLTEEEARTHHGEIDIYKTSFRALKHTLTGRDELVVMKIIVEAATDVVLGVHMLGGDAPELAQVFGIALQCCATKAQFDATVALHPSSAEEFVTMREKYVEPKAAQ